MPIYRVQGPDGKIYRVEGPEGASEEQLIQAVRAQYLSQPAQETPTEKTGFGAALRSGFEGLKGDIGAIGAGLGVEGAEEYARAQQEKAAQAYQMPEFTEAPIEYIKGLAGQSLPYIAAPLAAGAAAMGLGPIAAGAATGLTSLAQFTGSNVGRQIQEGATGEDLGLGRAALAAVPQAALDVVSFKAAPLIRNIFKAAGKELTETAAENIAKQGLTKTAQDYVFSTGKAMTAEGLTEAGQQLLERAQAGLALTDEAARDEYWDSLFGGALLGGVLAVPGRAVERSGEKRRAEALEQEAAAKEQRRIAAEEEAAAAQPTSPEYATQVKSQYDAFVERERALREILKAKLAPTDLAGREDKRNAKRELKELQQSPEYNETVKEYAKLRSRGAFGGVGPAAPVAAPTVEGQLEGFEAPGTMAVEAPIDEARLNEQRTNLLTNYRQLQALVQSEREVKFDYAQRGDIDAITRTNNRLQQLDAELKALSKEAKTLGLTKADLEGGVEANREQLESLLAENRAKLKALTEDSKKYSEKKVDALVAESQELQQRLNELAQTSLPLGAAINLPERRAREEMQARTETLEAQGQPRAEQEDLFAQEQAEGYEQARKEQAVEEPEIQALLRQAGFAEKGEEPTAEGYYASAALGATRQELEGVPQEERFIYTQPERPTGARRVPADQIRLFPDAGAAEVPRLDVLETRINSLLASDVDENTYNFLRRLEGVLPATDQDLEGGSFYQAVGDTLTRIEDNLRERGVETTFYGAPETARTSGIASALIDPREAQYREEKPEASARKLRADIQRTGVQRGVSPEEFERTTKARGADVTRREPIERAGRKPLLTLPKDSAPIIDERLAEFVQRRTEGERVAAAEAEGQQELFAQEGVAKTRQAFLAKQRAGKAKAGPKVSAATQASRERTAKDVKERKEAADKAVAKAKQTQRQLEARFGDTEKVERRAFAQISDAERRARERGTDLVTAAQKDVAEKDPVKTLAGLQNKEKALRRKIKSGIERSRSFLMQNTEKLLGTYTRLNDAYWKNPSPAAAEKVEQARAAYDDAVNRLKYQENIMWVGAGKDVEELQNTMARIEDLREGLESGRYIRLEDRETAGAPKGTTVTPKAQARAQEAKRAKESLAAVQKEGPVPTTSGEALTRSQVAKARKPQKTTYQSKGVSAATDENADRILEKLKKTGKITMSEANKVPFELLPKRVQNQLLVSRAAARDAKKAAALTGGRIVDVGDADIEYSVGTVEEGITAADVNKELDQAMGEKDVVKGSNGKVRVYNSVADFVAENPEYAGKIRPDARAFVQDGKAVLFGENIGQGQALAVLLHEVGAHVGMRGTMPTAQYNALVQTIKSWAKRTDNSLEARIGRAAMARVEAAQTPANQVNDELLAYAIEEATLAGVNPDANATVVERFLRMVTNAFNKVLRTFGLKGKDVNPVDLVNMAYGAAKLELTMPNKPAKVSDGEILFSVKAPKSMIVGSSPSVLSNIRGNVFGLAGRVQYLDNLAAVEETVRRGLGAGQISDAEATQTNYNLRIMGMANNFVGQAATHGPIRRVKTKEGDYVYRSEKGTNLGTIAEALREAEGVFPNTETAFTVYLAGKRAKKVGWEKLNRTKPAEAKAEYDAVMQKLASNAQARDAFKAAEDAWREVNNNNLDFLVATGEMKPELAATLKQQSYVPFFRMNGDEVQLFSEDEKIRTIGNIKDQPFLRELVGDDSTIQPFFTSAMRSIALLTRMGMRNATVKDTAYMLKKLGMASAIRQGPKPSGAEYMAFKQDGIPMYVKIDNDAFGVPAELVIKGLEGIKTTLPAAIRLMGLPADLLRYTVTRMPTYALRQVIRDPLSMFMTGNMNSTPIVSSIKQLISMQGGKSPTEAQLMQSGVINSNIFTGDSRDLDIFMRKILNGDSTWTKALSRLDALAMQGDAASRAVLWEESKKQGFTDIEADLRVLESMNFSRRGLSPSMLALNQMIPFFNAQVQGLDVLYRSMTGKMPYAQRLDMQKKMLQRGALVAAMSVIYAAFMQDDEAYQKATPEERNMYWFVYVPGTEKPLRVPIPFEVGYMFKALPEMLYNVMAGDTTTKQAAQAFGAFVKNSTPLSIPQGVKPLIEIAANKNFFTGLDIESQAERRLTPEERVRQDTTEFSRILGQAGVLSPVQIESLIRGYTGSMGVLFASLANPILRPFGGEERPEGPAKEWTDSPLIKSMFQPVDGRGLKQAAYDIVEEAQQASQTYKEMLKQGRRADAQAFLQENLKAVQAGAPAGQFRQQMGEWARLKRQVAASKVLTPEQKRDQIKQITALEDRYAKLLIESQR